MAFVSGPALPNTTRVTNNKTSICMRNSEPHSSSSVSRRDLIKTSLAAAAAALILPKKPAFADREYANVGFLGGGDQIDVNNANVRAYLKIKGFYPTIAGLLASNGPFKSFEELYNIPGMTDDLKEVLNANKEKLVFLPPAPEYEIDKLNNGLYK